jgi:WD40 repeat protein
MSLEGELPPEPVIPVATDDAAAVPARLDAFISYRRVPEDAGFVDYLEGALAGRGKHVWVDRAKIEPAADWSQRIALGIRNARALIFVVTPESVVSRECLRELDAAVQLHKLIVPVVLREISQDAKLPESLRRPNWILFATDRDRERALGEVIAALEEDLDWRDAHTRLAVRTREWTDAQRDRSFLLRGSDLSRAEDWLGQASQHQKTPPTALQTEYILASRKASVRAQRTWRSALSAGLVIALALAAVAFVQRNTARTQARIAQSRALAAEANLNLSSDPGQSLRLALNAAQLNAPGPAEQALRLAMAHDRLRMVIRTGAGSGAVAAWNPVLAQIAVTGPKDSVELWDTRTGRLTQVLKATGGHPVTQLLYDPHGSRLAVVASVGYVSMWDISGRGAASPVPTNGLNALIQADNAFRSVPGAGGESLSGAWAGPVGDVFDVYGIGLSNVLIFEPSSGATVRLFRQPFRSGGPTSLAISPDGTKLVFGLPFGGGDLIDFTNRSQTSPSPPPDSNAGPYCWFPDGSAVVTSTTVVAGGPVRIYKASTGTQSASMQTPDSTTAAACSAGAADEWVAAGDAVGHVILRLATGMVIPLDGHSDAIWAIASSPDGRYLATASFDGTARIWDARTGSLVTALTGDGAALTDVRFGPGGGLALTVDKLGIVRIWDTGIGEPLTVLSRPGPGQSVALRFTADGTHVLGAYLVTSTGPAAAVTSASVVVWDARSGQLVRQVNLPGIAASAVPCSATLQYIGDSASLGIMSGGRCGIPPSPGLVLAVPVPRPLNTVPAEDNAVLELLALAVSQDGRYAAYAQARSVAMVDTDDHVVATLPVASALVGLSFGSGSGDLLVVTDSAVYLWKPLSGRTPVVVPMPSTPIDATVSPSGAELAVVGTGGTVGVWSTASGRRLRTFTPSGTNSSSSYRPTPLRVAFSPDGTVVASGNADGTVDFWDIATGHRIAVRMVASWPILELSPAEHGSDLLAVDWPQTGSGPNAAGAAAVLNADTGQVIATYLSPAPRQAPVVPGAALSADGNFMVAGALGLAPSAPAGIAAAYQVSTGQLMADVQGAAGSPPASYSESPLRPWSPDGREFLAGTAIYACDSCGPLTSLQAAAAARISWSVPLSAGSNHPPAASPYG